MAKTKELDLISLYTRLDPARAKELTERIRQAVEREHKYFQGDDEVTRKIDDLKGQLQKARAWYEREAENIRKNPAYSDAGRADLIKKAYQDYMAKRSALKDELEQVRADERARLERDAFNAPMGKTAEYRAAITAASALKDRGEFDNALQLAEKTGDSLMIRALATISHGNSQDPDEHRWGIVRRAAQNDRDIARLVEFEAEHGVLRSAQQKFSQAVGLTAPMEPKELSRQDAKTIHDANIAGGG